jgi:hypothetical protein
MGVAVISNFKPILHSWHCHPSLTAIFFDFTNRPVFSCQVCTLQTSILLHVSGYGMAISVFERFSDLALLLAEKE